MGNMPQSIDLGLQKLESALRSTIPVVKIVTFIAGVILVYCLATLVLGPVYSLGKTLVAMFTMQCLGRKGKISNE